MAHENEDIDNSSRRWSLRIDWKRLDSDRPIEGIPGSACLKEIQKMVLKVELRHCFVFLGGLFLLQKWSGENLRKPFLILGL